ncbi:hypothetical protein BDZ89DRAFT_1074994 [Hymenopellis radicata]|nr:hypothetical protein BDZ89DRAFT_1074994 [Hymenopellis radicata]
MIWFLVLSLATQVVAQNFTCNTNAMDWYTKAVGETPCATYSRLRQICVPSYDISSLQSIFGSTPDYCTDEITDCCCNTVSFVLSMLCRNCQFGSGHNTFVGTYDVYLNKSGSTCSPNTNGSLPAHVQTAVCDNGIKIMDGIYTDTWPDGSWTYDYSIQTLTGDLGNNGGKVITKCDGAGDASVSVSADGTKASDSFSSNSDTSSSSASSSTSSPGSSSAALSTGAAVGIAVSATILGLLVISGIVVTLWMRIRKNKSSPLVHAVREITGGTSTPARISPFITARAPNLTQTANGGDSNRYPFPSSKSSSLHPLPSSSAGSSLSALPPRSSMRHVDAGPMEGLPPAYGDQVDGGVRRI